MHPPALRDKAGAAARPRQASQGLVHEAHAVQGPAPAPATRERLFLGIYEIAGILSDLAQTLSDRGCDVGGAVVANRFFAAPHPALRPLAPPNWLHRGWMRALWLRMRIALLLPPALLRYRTFVFVWSVTFLPANLDLILLRLLGRKVIIFNCGDDARYRPIHDRLDCEVLDYDWLGRNQSVRDEYLRSGNSFLKTFWFQKIQEWTGVRIVSSRNLATFQGVPCALFRMPQRACLDGPKTTRAVPLLVHAPSSRMVKGTAYVLTAIEKLRAEGHAFEFRIIENMSNDEVLATLREADIAIDQVCGCWPGRFGFEAMAAGCVLVGGYRPDYCAYPERLPIVPFEPDADRLAGTLRSLLEMPGERQRRMTESYESWRRHASSDAFFVWFRRLLDGNAETFDPLPNHRGHLLKFAENGWQRFLIRCLY